MLRHSSIVHWMPLYFEIFAILPYCGEFVSLSHPLGFITILKFDNFFKVETSKNINFTTKNMNPGVTPRNRGEILHQDLPL